MKKGYYKKVHYQKFVWKKCYNKNYYKKQCYKKYTSPLKWAKKVFSVKRNSEEISFALDKVKKQFAHFGDC